jgi:hypothetical protein
MIEVLIYSDDQDIRDHFRGVSRSKSYHVSFHPRAELFAAGACNADGIVIYYDIGGCTPEKARGECVRLGKSGCSWAVIDPQGIIEDPAELFYLGACDYLPPKLLSEGVRAARLHRVIEYQGDVSPPEHLRDPKNEELLPNGSKIIPSGEDWRKLEMGKEYSFFFLYIELVPGKEWRVDAGSTHRKALQEKFEKTILHKVAPQQGIIWMWSEWGGVVLFPFTKNNSHPVITATRLALGRPLISIEDMKVDTLIDYRLALHVGNTVYNRRGETGTLISDDINFIFHLGKKQIEKNILYLTGSAFPQVPERMRHLFEEEERFEGRRIYRMVEFHF